MYLEYLNKPIIIIQIVCLLFFIYRYLILPRKILFYKPLNISDVDDSLGVSIVIAAKNEGENLQKNLPSILNQNYSNFEVIVVNDQSYDDTQDVLREFAEIYHNLKVINISHQVNDFSGKKLALTVGIKSAKNDVILFTDADCYVTSENWIKTIQHQFKTDKVEFVIGYSPYQKFPSVLNFIIQYETFNTASLYLSTASIGVPYMAVGRNLAYRKSLFLEKKGFSPYLKIPYGDDDLFVNLHAHKHNTNIAIDKHSFVTSLPKTSWNDWWQQKTRHQSAAKYYSFHTKLISIVLWLMFILFYSSILLYIPQVLTYILSIELIISGGIILLVWIIQWIYALVVSRKLNTKYIWIFYPITEIFFHFIYQPFIGIFGLLRNNKRGW